jgi:hypothetical protein
MKRIVALLAGVVSVFVLAPGCGSSGGASCDTAKCANDPKPAIGAIQLCRDIQKGPCGSQYMDQRACLADNWRCGADGKVDPNSQVLALSACQMRTKAYQDCAAMAGGDGG